MRIFFVIQVFIMATIYSQSGLIAYYPFNGNASDESGNGNNGTVYGATLTSDRFGNGDSAYSFDGDNDYIEISNSTSLESAEAISFSLFYQAPDSGGPAEGRILNKDDQYLGDPDRSYYLRLDWIGDSTYKFYWYVYTTSGVHTQISYETSLHPNNWYHIAGIYDGNVHQFYFNNEMIEEIVVNQPRQTGNSPLYIGRLNYGGEYLSGSVDDIHLYGRSLSQYEIDSLYHFGGWDLQTNEGLVAYYPFNGNANDESGNGNDGTVYGATLTPDRFGNADSAYSFDGVDDYIQVPFDPSLQPTEQLTVSVFANLAEYSSYQAFVSNHAPGGWAIWVMQDSVGIDIQFPVNEDRIVARYSLANFPVNNWFHVVGVYDGSSIDLYINGELKMETPFTGPISYLYNNDIHIGAHVNSGYFPFVDGILDDIYIYDRALSETEIDSLYHQGSWDILETATMTDIDDNVYQTVKIGNQWWMAENLKVTHYPNGDPISTGFTNTEWANLSEGAYSVYNDDPNNADTYGYLYNWYAVDDNRNIAPEGWHVPSDADWKQMEIYLGMSQSDVDAIGWRGTNEGGKLKELGTEHWNSPNTGATNETGFTALPSGRRANSVGIYQAIGTNCYFWTTTEHDNELALFRELYYLYSGFYRGNYDKRFGFSIRCVKNATDVYTVSIGNTQVSQIDTSLVPVSIAGAQGVNINSFELTLNKGSGDLLFMEIDTNNTLIGGAGWMVALNETDSTILFAAAGSNEIITDGTLLYLRYAPMGEPCNTIPITINTCIVNTGSDSLTLENGSVTILPVPDYGDVDENGAVQAYDAAMILKHIVGLDTLDCQGIANSDVSLNDTISALDASLILQYVVDSIDTLPFTEPLLATGEISVGETSAGANQLVTIPIEISDGSNIYSLEGIISFDNNQMQFEDITFLGQSSTVINTQLSNDILKFAFASTEPLVIDGELGTIQFITSSDFAGSGVTIETILANENLHFENITAEVALGIGKELPLPTNFALRQNYPNPFNPVTRIKYELPEKSNVQIAIYDMLGRQIRTLVNQNQEAGYRTVIWNGMDDNGSPVSTGLYLYMIKAGDFSQTRKMILLK